MRDSLYSGGFPPPAAPVSGAVPASSPPPGETTAPSEAPALHPGEIPPFQPFGAAAFDLARQRHVPVFLVIGELEPAFADPALAAQIAERTVAVQLLPGMRPDVEQLCLRASGLFSEESALPLCALLLDDARPFLAAPLPPPGYPIDPARLYVWLSQADRRFAQNLPALTAQAAQVVRTFRTAPLRKPYAPADAAHDLRRALDAVEDKQSGGFGRQKAPFVTGLRFLQHAAARGDSGAHAALSRALDAMLASALYDPLDGGFFRATLTDDWRVFIPQKPLGINALLALILLESGRRSEAVGVLDFLLRTMPLDGGAFAPYVSAPAAAYAFTPEQACAALGSEEGLRACRLLGLLQQHARPLPSLTPSRFSPVPQGARRRFQEESAPLCPHLSPALTPEDAAFLRRALPRLLRARAAREPQRCAPIVLGEDAALAAYVFAVCGRRLGEARYTQAAQRAVSALLRLTPAGPYALPPAYSPAPLSQSVPLCGASAALALALLALGQTAGLESYAESGLRLLGAALHAFLGPNGALLHTPDDPAAFFPRLPAIWDSELPAPAATMVRALRLADGLRPQAHYAGTIEAIWDFAAPYVREQPLACAALIDAMTEA